MEERDSKDEGGEEGCGCGSSSRTKDRSIQGQIDVFGTLSEQIQEVLERMIGGWYRYTGWRAQV